MGLSMDKINPAPYNPRTITDHAKEGLSYSMEEFGDISGITWNKKTGNLVSGHQRYDNLVKNYKILTFGPVVNEKMEILSKDGAPTGFDMRVVDWDQSKEEAANITANSSAIAGNWNLDKLGSLLPTIPQDMSERLRMDMLASDLGLKSMEWNSDLEKMDKVEADDSDVPAVIKILISKTDKDEVLEIIKECLEDYDCKIED